MPNVAELIKDHVTLTVDCVDRLYLNAYVPRLQSEGGLVGFLRQRGQHIPSPALFGRITEAFRVGLRAWCEGQGIPWLEFQKGTRKDDLVQPYRDRFTAAEGVVLVGVAQERANSWRATKQVQGTRLHFTYRRTTANVNHYYFYLLDPERGPAFLKVCSYLPFTMKLSLNGHEWAKRQLAKQGIPFQALDNGFLQCADPAALKTVADALGPRDIEAFFDRWVARLPLPLSEADQAVGFGYGLSILQMEVSRTQVFDRPLRGREFFEEVIRDNLDLGRPSRVQLLFDRTITRRTPGRLSTRVITHGVIPQSPHRVQALPHQAVLQGGARPAHRNHLQRHLRLRGPAWSELLCLPPYARSAHQRPPPGAGTCGPRLRALRCPPGHPGLARPHPRGPARPWPQVRPALGHRPVAGPLPVRTDP